MSGLEEWARARAPELLARAEEEAVAALRQALIDATVGGRPAAPKPARSRESRRDQAEGHALWAYAVTRAGQALSGAPAGVDPGAPVERIVHGGLAVLASRVPLAEFGEDPLRENLNRLDWLERVARAHETVLEQALADGPIVPLRLCTIYSDEDGIRAMLDREEKHLTGTLDRLAGRQEWGVKLLLDRDTLARAARERSPEIAGLEEERLGRSGGGAYMIGRKVDRRMAELTHQLATEVAEDVHARLEDCTEDSVLNPPQNRELSGYEGEMLLNGAYLVESSRTEELRDVLTRLEERHSAFGARLELTGPWPPYNFASRLAPA